MNGHTQYSRPHPVGPAGSAGAAEPADAGEPAGADPAVGSGVPPTVLAWGDARTPPLRNVLATLLSRAAEADLAVAHVRLLAVDLSREESAAMARCRMLLGRLDSAALGELGRPRLPSPGAAGGMTFGDHDAPGGNGAGNAHVARLLRLLDSGRVQVRSGGAASWVPDFSVFRGLPPSPQAPAGCVGLLGAHYFARPLAGPGAALTAVLTAPAAVRSMTQHFDTLWSGAHDVSEAVRGVLADLLAA